MFSFILTILFAIGKRQDCLLVAWLDVSISFQTQRHNSEYVCYCFKCLLAGLLVNILHSSRHLGLLSIIVKDNCLMSDRYVSDFFKEIKRKAIDF